MKLLVIGHSVLDFIQRQETIGTSAGGIFYTITALNQIKTEEDEIYLCSQFDEHTFKYFKSEYENIQNNYLTKVDSIPKIHLKIFNDQERHEAYENITENLTTKFENLNKFDGILINMITGFDINLSQLRQIRSDYSGLIYFDVHTLSRGLDEEFKREFRNIPDFSEWAKCLDIIQVNQSELFTLSDNNSEIKIVNEMFQYGIKIICITKGEKGAKVFYQKSEEIASYFIAAKRIKNPYTIGCGDVFGASFFYSYIRNNNVNYSLFYSIEEAEKFVERKTYY